MGLDNNMLESKSSMRSHLIERIGPWAFQSFSRSKWHQVSDDDIIEGALVSAPEEDKLRLLELYSLPQIAKVWRSKVLIQDSWSHSNNVWIARNLFRQNSPEKFVDLAYRESIKQRARQLEHGRPIVCG